MPKTYDLIVLGGGSAGFNAARVAASLGKKVAVVDGAKKLGGLCILRGCMPSKTLIYAAEILHLARTGADFGLKVGSASADMGAMQKRKRRIIADFALHRIRQLKAGNFDLVRSNGRFVDSHTIELKGGKKIRAENILIGTGSKVSVPPLPGLASTPFWTSDDVLELEKTPRSVIVLGGGIVATELAQFLARAGTRVCLIQRGDRILRGSSPEASAVVTKAFRDEGIEVHTGTDITDIRTSRGGAQVTFKRKGKTHVKRADHLFNALGREPDTSRLNLEAAGIKTAKNGRILINKWQQTTSPNVYAAGDCSGPHEIVHVAIQQAELAARHMSGVRNLKPLDDSTLLSVVFTDPQVASMGWHDEDLRKKGAKFHSASYPFNDHGRSILMNANYGYARVSASRGNGRILGAEIVGKDAGELIHSLTTPITMGATVQDLLDAPWYHPTLSEIVTYPMEEIAEKLKGKSSN
ncbi:MAG TPA: dihydrolipoyl dehydrogenase [Opitutaceae bacterium]|jgi:pyruvate/2-oxoglutarate dehydrogenase complex dihydrolipoamide dehydrogenase (E3) component|nr:dihydrolipoyl dehydrogenase [Opitutaceae bacterium]